MHQIPTLTYFTKRENCTSVTDVMQRALLFGFCKRYNIDTHSIGIFNCKMSASPLEPLVIQPSNVDNFGDLWITKC